jgi:phosphomannomutase
LQKIRFGTDGWRAVIADEFTVSNVRRVTRAVARFLEEEGRAASGVVVGYDNRFLAEEFAAQAAAALMDKGVKVYLCRRPAPTPAVAYAVKHLESAGAIMFTASHNPYRYQGIKFIPHYAGPAMPRETDRIGELLRQEMEEEGDGRGAAPVSMQEELLESLRILLENREEYPEDANYGVGFVEGNENNSGMKYSSRGLLEIIEPEGPYLKHLEGIIDRDAIAAAPPFVVLDSMHGAGIGYIEAFLLPLGCRVEVIRGFRDPFFGGGLPDPSKDNLHKLRSLVLEMQAHAGLALDGDGDRLGVIGPEGEYLSANEILTLFMEYLVQHRKMSGVVARTVATTHNLDRLAGLYNMRLVETPVGFKYIGSVMREEGAFLGGEESGGISIRGHIPEKDGIMASLLFVEMLAATGAGPGELFRRLRKKIELLSFERLDIHTLPGKKEKALEKMMAWEPEELAGLKVETINRIDGIKILLEGGSWCLVRASGTENVFRIYLEAPDRGLFEKMQQELRQQLKI